MKEQPEIIKRFRSLTHKTIHDVKNYLNDECSLLGEKHCATRFAKQMELLEAFVLGMISQLGNEYLKTIQNWATDSCTIIATQTQNRDLQQKLDHACQILQQKNSQIQDLQNKNMILSQTVAALQQTVAAQASLINGEDILSQDSMDNVDVEELDQYLSEPGSDEEESVGNEQVDYGL